MSLETGRLKEKELPLPEPIKPLPQRRGAPWQIEGLGSQGAFNSVSQVKAMAQLGHLPINSLFIGVSDGSESKSAVKALKDIKAGIGDKIASVLGIARSEFPPYCAGMPSNLGIGVGSVEEAIRVHNEVTKWVEREMIPWCKEHWAANLLRFTGIGCTGLIFGAVRDSILALEGWAKRQFRVVYTHVATEPPRTLIFLKEFFEFSDILSKEISCKTLMPTFDVALVSYEGVKPPEERPWEAMDWNWMKRITREKAEMVHHMAFAIHSRAGIQPSLKEILLLADLSPIKTIYVTERILTTPLKKGLIGGARVNEELNKEGLQGCTRDILHDLYENGVRRQCVITCFGQLSEDWYDIIKAEAESLGLDLKINIAGLRFGSKYSFIVGQGPVVNRPVRFIEEPLGIWNSRSASSSDAGEIEMLIPGDLNRKEENGYLRIFNVYAKALKLRSAYEIFSWKNY